MKLWGDGANLTKQRGSANVAIFLKREIKCLPMQASALTHLATDSQTVRIQSRREGEVPLTGRRVKLEAITFNFLLINNVSFTKFDKKTMKLYIDLKSVR